MDVLADITSNGIRLLPDGLRDAEFHIGEGTFSTGRQRVVRLLTVALASVFGLEIHVVSLLEPTLTEEKLGMLFTNLPARCIVLLEDIDTAGLVRNDPASDEENSKPSSDPNGNDWSVVNVTKVIEKANEQSEDERQQRISLSGLLNMLMVSSRSPLTIVIQIVNSNRHSITYRPYPNDDDQPS